MALSVTSVTSGVGLADQAGAIIWWNDRIVLRRNKRGRWLFPKGHIELGETPVETACREAEEETGLLVEAMSELGRVVMRVDRETIDLRLFALQASGVGPRWQRHLGKDTFLVRPEQVAAHLSFPELREFWEAHRAEIQALERAEPKPRR